MAKFTVYLDQQDILDLRMLALKRHQTTSQMVRDLLTTYLEDEERDGRLRRGATSLMAQLRQDDAGGAIRPLPGQLEAFSDETRMLLSDDDRTLTVYQELRVPGADDVE